jgi:hypothetical protein
MKALRTFSVLVAVSLAGAAYAQPQMAPDTPSASVTNPTPNPELDGASTARRSGDWRSDATQVAAASSGIIESGMPVKSQSGAVLGTVASIVPSDFNNEDYVVIANPQGIAIPVPYRTATTMVRNDALVMNETRFENAPKVQQYQTEDASSSLWEHKADNYWKR